MYTGEACEMRLFIATLAEKNVLEMHLFCND